MLIFFEKTEAGYCYKHYAYKKKDMYIQQNFSWKSLLTMPVNLTSFSISSTYDTLPYPRNLMRCKLTTEASCFLRNKDMCTTSHILGGCKVALSKGRFTFRHDNALRIIISNIRSLIKTIKSSVPTSKQPMKIKFGKKLTKVKKKTQILLPVGYYIRHQTGSC